LFELPAITVQHRGVDPVIIGHGRAIDAKVQLNRSPADDVADRRFDFRLECGVTVARAVAKFEMPAVDRADFHGDRHVARLLTSFAKAGHADEQG
jgi:hypothetical protein